MRLIDADAFKEFIADAIKKQNGTDKDLVKVSELPIIVDQQPTAYDTDKVVEQLEEFRPEMEQFVCGCILTDIIEVVKGGGANE
ncbi:MAG: hypothetical protein PUJ55_09860 [Clostridiales bacterium]|nr:hypothetical protein [Clostridiales bacterium]MDY4113121.1 hypothetical protein [Roseburia sp.]